MFLIITVLYWILFYVILGIAHGQVAKQLEFMSYKDRDNAVKYKARWHTTFAILRIYLHVTFPIALISFLPFDQVILLFFLSATIGILLFDSMVDIGRGKGINWKFLGTCEGNWDGDCLWLWLDKYIPHLILKSLLVLIVLAIYLIT